MKKLFTVLAIITVLPVSVYAMKPMADQELSHVTAMAGVSFFVDITMNISIDTIAWGDSDGLAPGPYNPWSINTSGGYVGVTNFRVTNLSVRPRTDGYNIISSSTYWPAEATIDVYNGIPYYHVHAGVQGIQ
ncbi:MAG: hypothetical protein JXM72_09620 [Deltaproteobacteria bacterium]|nr:hypothetical protein [Deltaproteobacteria bacterium]